MGRVSKIITRLVVLLCLCMMVTPIYAATIISINPNDDTSIQECLGVAAHASSQGSNVTLKDGKYTATKVEVKTTKGGRNTTATMVLFSYAHNVLTFDEEAYHQVDAKEAKKVISAFVEALKDSNIPNSAQQDIMTTIQESDSDVAALMIPLIFDNTKADIFTAYKWLYPFLSVVRVIFGIGAVLIIFLALGSTIMDLVYIGVPVWRENQAKEGNVGKKPFGVSYEAMATVKQVEKNLEVYQNAYLLYFKKRAITYVVLAIAILYLVVGELGGLISWVLQLASGVV